ncbi:protease modulator HflC [bacterium]|nr:protease modulator HflC [bacterium]
MRKIGIVIVIFILTYFALSLYVVDETEWGIITQFGKPVKTEVNPGLYLKLPTPIQDVYYFDKRSEVIKTQPIQFLLKENKPIIVSTYITWRIKNPLLFFEAVVYKKSAVSKLEDMANSNLGNLLGQYRVDQIINTNKSFIKTDEIEKTLKELMNKESFEKYGIEIISVGFVRISYPAIVTTAVYKRMKTERETEAKAIRAKGEEEAKKIKTDADKEAKEILSEAEKKALITKAEADAEVLKLYGKTYEQSYEYFNYLKSIESYSKILKKRTTLIFSTDSKMFKNLEGENE